MSISFTGPSGFSASINNIGLYSDTTPMVKTDQFDDIVKHADTMIVRADSLSEFVVGMFLYDSLYASECHVMKLVLPYIPGARQDRINPTGDVLFTMKSVAQMINYRNFSKVVVADPHSPVAPGHIWYVTQYPLQEIYKHLWGGYTGVISPDKGARERAKVAGKVLGKPVFEGSKVRDVATGKLTGFQVEDLTPGGHYIVVDDICDGGGTFIGLGEKIREQGCYADLFVTHGIFSKGTNELKKIYKNIYTTDTRDFHERNDVMKFNIVDDMVNY